MQVIFSKNNQYLKIAYKKIPMYGLHRDFNILN